MTQFLSLDAIRTLGLYDDLCRLFRRAGMLDFLERRDVTYPCLILEFLVTIMRVEDIFTFRFRDMEYTLSCRDMSSVFGCLHGPALPEYVELSVEGCAQLWMDVTAGTLDKKGGLLKEITHPILRLAHRMLAIPFYGQENSSKISHQGISVLHALCTSGAHLPVWPMLFFHTCHKIRMATSGPICLGGMITMIASSCRCGL